MSSTQTNQRFTDKNYKNWLITAESLSLVRNGLQPFVEKETETYHESLKKIPYLEGKRCKNNCNKKFCNLCNNWKKEISSNHAKPTFIYWDNCRPYLWPTDKWEVCKAYMPRGHRQHSEFAQFDVAAILNLMNFCKHFTVPENNLTDVLQVRNSVMHSPAFTINDDDKNKHLTTILALTKILENQAPELKSVPEKIKQFNKILHKTFSQDQCEVDGNHDLQTLNERQEVLDREQQILKDKIEELLLQFEGNEVENEDITALVEFLEKNKDLLEHLGPEVSKLKEINEKVCLHEEQIKNLTGRVENLENNTHDSIPTSSSPRYKNQLYEYCRDKKWPEPVFSMANEAQVSGSGYKAKVTVNKTIFTGKQMFKKLVDAHQEVASIALQQLKLLDENKEESRASSSSSTGSIFFGKVRVFLDQEFESDRCNSEEDAVESAYKVLSRRFQHVSAQAEGQTIKTAILEHFRSNDFPEPSENIVKNGDNTTTCKLKVGIFTFNDNDGATKKKQAEQQAARVALHHLSGFLDCSPGSDTEDHISLLKVAIEKLHLSPPLYDTEQKQRCSEPVARSINASTTAEMLTDELDLRPVSITTPYHQESLDSVPASKRQDPPDSTDPVFPNKKARIACPLTPELDELLNVFNLKPPRVKAQNRDEHSFKCLVEIHFDNFTCTDKKGNDSKKEAIRKIYLMFGRAVGIIDATADEKLVSMLVKQNFSQKSLVPPQEEVNNSKPFCCSLKNITYTATYEEQGSSETEARLRALRRTLMAISPLFGYPSLAAADTLTDVESQLGSLLTGAGQKEPSISIKQLIKAGVQVSFSDYTVTCNCQKTRKAAHGHLSSRILRVLGEKTGSEGPSLRNSLDEWFQKHKLPPPVFKDTGKGHGAEATFTAELFCYSPDWEQDFKTATEKLCETLKNQFQFLTEKEKQ